MPELFYQLVPKETVSDDTYIFIEATVNPGKPVKKNETIARFESSKGVFDVGAEHEGHVAFRYNPGEHVAVGSVFAVISPEPLQSVSWDSQTASAPAASASAPVQSVAGEPCMGQGPRFSKQAQELANKHGLTAHLFSGHSLVTRANVESYLARRAEPEKKNLSVVPAVSGSPGDAIVVLGGGGHARMCLDILQQRGEYKIVGILDPGLRKGEHVFGVPILGGDDCLPELAKNGVRLAVNGIGSVTQTAFREKVYSKLKDLGFTLPNLIHPRAVVEPSVQMGEGNQVMAGTVLGSAARVGNNCIINTSAVVSHDCVLEDHAHIAPGAILGGSVRVGPKSLIGMGVTIYFGLTIGHNVTIVNGVDVFGDVRDNTIVRGKISHG